MKRILSGLVTVTLSTVLWTAPANADPIFSFDPASASVTEDDIVSVAVVATNLDDIISGFNILVDFDESLLSLNSVDEPCGGIWLDLTFTFEFGLALCDVIPAAGTVDVSLLSFESDAPLADFYQAGLTSLTLFTMNFTAIGDGIAEFAFVWDQFHDVKCSALEDDPDTARVCSPTSVPEPGTLALLGLGLIGMGAARRRNRAS